MSDETNGRPKTCCCGSEEVMRLRTALAAAEAREKAKDEALEKARLWTMDLRKALVEHRCDGKGDKSFNWAELILRYGANGRELFDAFARPAPKPEAKRGKCDMPSCRGLGVIGNEQIVGGKKVCDYCHATTAPVPLPAEAKECACQFCPCEKNPRCSICGGTGKQVCPSCQEPKK